MKHEPGHARIGSFELRQATRDGMPIWYLRCPKCGTWGELDDDQLHGRVSVDHTQTEDGRPTGCDFHETHDFAAQLAD